MTGYSLADVPRFRYMYMAGWEDKLNQFLQFNGREVFQNFGTVKCEAAEALAAEEYEKYDAHRRAIEAANLNELTDGVKKLKN